MLVLTRRLNQTVVIGDPKDPGPKIEVTVIEVRGDQVRLGVSAPRELTVHREEIYKIYKQIQEENCTAADPHRGDVPERP